MKEKFFGNESLINIIEATALVIVGLSVLMEVLVSIFLSLKEFIVSNMISRRVSNQNDSKLIFTKLKHKNILKNILKNQTKRVKQNENKLFKSDLGLQQLNRFKLEVIDSN
jgi:hypothetical protein